jgi:hypothetical protein
MSRGVPHWTMRPPFHDGDAVAELERLVEVVADEDDGAVALSLEVEELVLEARADQGVEGREGLVHQEDRGVGGEGAGEAHALLHPARELAHQGVRAVMEVDELELLLDAGGALAAGLAAQLQPRPRCRARCAREEAELLEHHGDGALAQARAGLRGRPW